MKIKSDFVTNSSSSSFVIDLIHLTELQIYLIENHGTISKESNIYYDEPWTITINDGELSGYTYMDNFDMEHYLSSIGVPMHFVKWEY